MLALILAVFTASLLGSTHCAGMCGAFVAFAVMGPAGAAKQPSRWSLNAAYNLGRLATYITIGAFAGALGAALDLGGSMVGVQRAAAIAAGAMMVGFGLIAVARHLGVRIPRVPLPPALIHLARAGHAKAFVLSPLARAAAVGLLTTLLPCGWLYAFAITSAGTASPLWGAVTMAAFWAGTLPMMGALGLGAQSLSGPLRKHLPLTTSLLLVVVGCWTLLGRMTMPAMASVHTPANVEEAITSIDHADEACPLCRLKHK
ncbi:MAG TPA: sulfite exporter TauE/SafE family protein [Phycisphaerales bacterium]|nr:sulfite exporter TauE/SafE family protein [Phycisphaerales bacterium]